MERGRDRRGWSCCKFEDLIGTANGLIEAANPDVILGEPVGSCTDLSATVLQPLKDTLAHQFDWRLHRAH